MNLLDPLLKKHIGFIKLSYKVSGYIEYNMYFDFKQGLRFSISVPNYSYCTRSPFKCIFLALEHSDVGMGKYQRLKERTRKLGMWQKL